MRLIVAVEAPVLRHRHLVQPPRLLPHRERLPHLNVDLGFLPVQHDEESRAGMRRTVRPLEQVDDSEPPVEQVVMLLAVSV
jgi:hypothetical protein